MSVILGLWCLGAVLASASADAETDHKCHRGQAREGAAGGGGRRLRREMRVFPPLALTVTKQ